MCIQGRKYHFKTDEGGLLRGWHLKYMLKKWFWKNKSSGYFRWRKYYEQI